MTVALLALAAIPPFAGFFSKEAVLGAAEHAATGHTEHVPGAAGWTVLVAGLLTALLTAAYATRLWLLAFRGRGAEAPDHGRQPLAMNAVLWVLAVPSLALGAFAYGYAPRLVRRRRPRPDPHHLRPRHGRRPGRRPGHLRRLAAHHAPRRRPRPAGRGRRPPGRATPPRSRRRPSPPTRPPTATSPAPPTRPTRAGSCSARCTATRPPASTSTPSTAPCSSARSRPAPSLVRFLDREVVDTYVRGAGAVPRLLGAAVRRAQTGNVQTYLERAARRLRRPGGRRRPRRHGSVSRRDRYQRVRDAVPSGVHRRRPAPRRRRRSAAGPARTEGEVTRAGRAAPRRHRHRRGPRRRDRPRARLRPRPAVEDAGHDGHQLDPRTRRAHPPRHRRHLPPPSGPDRAADLPLRALLATSRCPRARPRRPSSPCCSSSSPAPSPPSPSSICCCSSSPSRWSSSRCTSSSPAGAVRNGSAAAWKFILYTLLGSVVMLLGLLLIGVKAGTFDMVALATDNGRCLTASVQVIAVLVDRDRARGQDPDVAAAQLAARRPHRRPDRRLGPAGRRPAEDGYVRIRPDPAADRARRHSAPSRPTSPPSPSSASSTDPSPASPSPSRARRATSSASSPTPPSATWASSCSASPP